MWNKEKLQKNRKIKEAGGIALIVGSVDEVKAALKRVQRNPESRLAIDEVLSLEKFFYSQWYQALTTVDGVFLIRKIRAE